MAADAGIPHSAYRRAMVLLRTFLGLVYLTNGLAKLFSVHTVRIGPWTTYLINRDDALGIQRANTRSSPGFLHHLGDAVIAHWGFVQWLLTAGELTVGVGLLAGILSRLSALAGLGLAIGVLIFTLGAGGWTYDYLFEPILLALLATVGDLPGIDTRIRWLQHSRFPE